MIFVEEIVSVIVDCGAVPVLVTHLQLPPLGDAPTRLYEYEVEKGSAFALGLLAVKVILFYASFLFCFYRFIDCCLQN